MAAALVQQLSLLQNQVSAAKSAARAATDRADSLARDLAARDATIAALQGDVVSLRSNIARLEATARRSEEEVHRLRTHVGDKEKEISGLMTSIEAGKKALSQERLTFATHVADVLACVQVSTDCAQTEGSVHAEAPPFNTSHTPSSSNACASTWKAPTPSITGVGADAGVLANKAQQAVGNTSAITVCCATGSCTDEDAGVMVVEEEVAQHSGATVLAA